MSGQAVERYASKVKVRYVFKVLSSNAMHGLDSLSS